MYAPQDGSIAREDTTFNGIDLCYLCMAAAAAAAARLSEETVFFAVCVSRRKIDVLVRFLNPFGWNHFRFDPSL